MVAYVFPGQGVQFKGMGEHLFKNFKEIVAKADAILGFSIEDLCLNDPQQLLNNTEYTQPAIYVVNALSYYSQTRTQNLNVRFLAGHSLGEYNALLVAEVFNFETGLILVKKRSELMSQCAQGAMAAIVGLDAKAIAHVIEINNLKNIEVANYNCHKQFVISGLREDVKKSLPFFDKAGAAASILLKVSGAFHSSFMKSSQDEFKKFIHNFYFSKPKTPVISNISAAEYKFNDIHNNLVEQISKPVLWTNTIEYLISQNITNFVEVGPGNILSQLVKSIKNDL